MKCLYEIWRDAFDIENENLLDLHVSGVKPDSVPIAILWPPLLSLSLIEEVVSCILSMSNDQSRDADTCS